MEVLFTLLFQLFSTERYVEPDGSTKSWNLNLLSH